MTRFLKALRLFFRRENPVTPAADALLHGGLNPAARNELFYAELIEDKWEPRFRDIHWPPGWLG